MDAFTITGGYPLSGTIRIHGGKNAALPQLAASLLTDEPIVLHDIPRLDDIRNMCRLLNELGVRISGDLESPDAPPGPYRTVALQAVDPTRSHARYDIVRTMRASISVLGPMLARRGEARVSLPGGCAIGDRPIDIHLRGLRALGAEFRLEQGDVIARAPGGRLVGGTVFLGGPFGSTVLGTANVMSAATLAEGRTVIECAACEPEIADLAVLLNAMGAQISGAGTPRITIEGVDTLHATTHTVMPDRIEAGTFMIASAITRGDVTLENCPLDALLAFVDTLHGAGVSIDVIDQTDPMRAICRVRREGDLLPVQVTTQPHPGFATDLQAQLMSLLTLARGNSVITERIFPQRFLHVAELSRMGADIHREGATAVVHGVGELVGAPVMASDLRASACLVLAGLASTGTTTVNRVYHIDRGYEQIERMLQALGAEIQRVEVVTKTTSVEAQAERMAG
ncbi:MAG: UDP-N-acetylglucosamine 1-carboxyvinyltransferase [Phycisphaerales bacterium JB043]